MLCGLHSVCVAFTLQLKPISPLWSEWNESVTIIFHHRAHMSHFITKTALSFSTTVEHVFLSLLDLNILACSSGPDCFQHIWVSQDDFQLSNSQFLLFWQPLRGVVVLKQAIDKMQMNTNQLTSVHADLCQVSSWHHPSCNPSTSPFPYAV